jgi:hypothetical protein
MKDLIKKILLEYVNHLDEGLGRPKKWSEDKIRNEILKYNSLLELRQKNYNLYQAAYKQGPKFFDDVTSHLDKGYWTDSEIRNEVLKYDSSLELRQKNINLYNAIDRRGTDYLKDVTSHMVKASKWNDQALRDEAQKYNSRSEFGKKSPTAYNKARLRKDFYDDITSHMRKPNRTED